MGTKHPNHRLTKIHRNYMVDEVANLFGIHRNTVRAWIKSGLKTNDDKRPVLILGRDLVAFVKARRMQAKQPCRAGELYCLRCRAPKVPAGGMVEYKATTLTLGNLIAMCPDCEAIMNRRTSLAKLDVLRHHMDITMPQALRHIVESTQPSVNSDLNYGALNHDNA